MSCTSQTSPRAALVFDLDDTLVSTSVIQPEREHIAIRVRRRRLFAKPRPGLTTFLKTVSQRYDVYFFTASAREYANPIIDAISPDTPPERRFFRESCFPYSGYPVKDLRIIGRPLNRVLLIDDLAGSALLQPENILRISPWHGTNENDSVLLLQLLPLLHDISWEEDLPRAARDSVCKHGCTDLFPLMLSALREEPESPQAP
jgi:Dullard-like phosphatase family protein